MDKQGGNNASLRQRFGPGFHADNRQGKFERLLPFGRVSPAEHLVDGPLSPIETAPQAKSQTTFPRMVNMTVQDEGIDSIDALHAIVSVGISGRLIAFAGVTVDRMEALL